MMYRITFLGPALTMHAGGFSWEQGKSRVLDVNVARELARAYKFAKWELEEVVEPARKSEPSRRRGRKQAELEPAPEVEVTSEVEAAPETEEAPPESAAFLAETFTEEELGGT